MLVEEARVLARDRLYGMLSSLYSTGWPPVISEPSHQGDADDVRVGALGSLNGLDLAHRKGAGFFLASTSEVYGDPQIHPQPESYWGNVNPIGPRGVYVEAKRYAEAMTMAYHS